MSLHSIRLRPPGRLLTVALIVFALLFFAYSSIESAASKQSAKDDQNVASLQHWTYSPPANINHPNPRLKAAVVTFVRGDRGTMTKLRQTMRNIEDSFNNKHGYPYIIFTDENLSTEFKELVSSSTKGDVIFEKVGKDYYGYPKGIDMKKAAEARENMKNVMFGDSEDYRFNSRFLAGTIFRHPALQDIDYYWRIEAGTEYVCPIGFDPFDYMLDHNKKMSFSLALYEYHETLPSLWGTVKDFAKEHPNLVTPDEPGSLWKFVKDPNSGDYNRCHFWSNFQIADLSFYRSEEYQAFFNHLDKSGGFFYERWGDPVIHTMAAVLFLKKEDVHYWDNIGYSVANFFINCPKDKGLWSQCTCRPERNFATNDYSCYPWFANA
ncbi:hypothetical protein INT43_005194 [Umbelopsis isabellina]|uniref:Uncharacterized protein n=1 Tax=Mortierella isabellina TaxID=91625 RepID=A0A8H7PGW4_MORIS|nr:hypothetical protein INT43_005194 [Umbelopsis isabellina]